MQKFKYGMHKWELQLAIPPFFKYINTMVNSKTKKVCITQMLAISYIMSRNISYPNQQINTKCITYSNLYPNPQSINCIIIHTEVTNPNYYNPN